MVIIMVITVIVFSCLSLKDDGVSSDSVPFNSNGYFLYFGTAILAF